MKCDQDHSAADQNGREIGAQETGHLGGVACDIDEIDQNVAALKTGIECRKAGKNRAKNRRCIRRASCGGGDISLCWLAKMAP